MAARLLLRRGRAEALKTMLLEVPVFRAPTVSLSAQSGKNDKELPPNPKKRSPPKNVEEPKERGKLLTSRPAAAVPPSLSPCTSSPAAGNRGGAVAGAHPSGGMLLMEEGLPKPLARKTLVAFPQKVPSLFRAQGLGAETHRDDQKATDDSFSSSSSSSDSESDEERDIPEAGPWVGSKGQGGSPRPEATQACENRAPRVALSAKKKSRAQQPHIDGTYPEKPSQPKKKMSPRNPLENREEATRECGTPRSQAEGEVLKQNVKKEQLQKTRLPNEPEEGSRKPWGGEGVSLDHTVAGLSAQLGGSLVPMPGTKEAACPGAQDPEPGGKMAPPRIREETAGKQVGRGHLKAKEEILENQGAVRSSKPVPIQEEEAQTAGLKPEEGAAPPPDDTQESAEPHDNTTYKNLQHHDYGAYTFLDLNLDLSKFRLPQPSSGRESPRH